MSELSFIEAPSPNFDERDAPVDILLLHYTGMASGEAALRKLCDPKPVWASYVGDIPERFFPENLNEAIPPVSAHYMVGEDGRVFRLVDEAKRAWHGGVGFWAGETNISARSIGVEIVNAGHDLGLPDFPHAQIEAVIALCKDVLARHPIPPTRVLGHSDVTPGRKEDPGEKFPWPRLAEEGIGLWPGAGDGDKTRLAATGDAGPAVRAAQDTLIDIGYGLAASGAMDDRTVAVVEAFQRRYRRERVDGVLDEETADLIVRVAGLCGV